MSEHNVSDRPLISWVPPTTPMDAVKQVYKLFQTRENFTIGSLARNHRGREITSNDVDACCWCLSGAVLRVYNLDFYNLAATANIACKYADYKTPKELPERLKDTFKLLWEKIPAGSKIGYSYPSICSYIDGIARFNDIYGYTGVMRLLQAVVDDTEYVVEV